jgi:hypothetical protein
MIGIWPRVRKSSERCSGIPFEMCLAAEIPLQRLVVRDDDGRSRCALENTLFSDELGRLQSDLLSAWSQALYVNLGCGTYLVLPKRQVV